MIHFIVYWPNGSWFRWPARRSALTTIEQSAAGAEVAFSRPAQVTPS
jgi:hypothetical protein